MSEIFDLLARNGLKDDAQIESIVMNKWSIGDIVTMSNEISQVLEKNIKPREQRLLTDYTFVPNSDMSAQHHGGCPEWNCRLRRIDNLSRFCTMYADQVYIQNYFAEFEHEPTTKHEEFHFRYTFAGDLKVMLRLRPLIENGIIQWVPQTEPGFHMCPSCAKELIPSFEEVNERLERHIDALNKKYLKDTSATLEKTPELGLYFVHSKGSKELWEHGEVISILEQAPRSMLAKLKASVEKSQLSKRDIDKLGVVRGTLHEIALDIWTKHFLSRFLGLNAKYLTNREIDISFIEAITEDTDFKMYNQILKARLLIELPILDGIPISQLLDIRRKEFGAFLLYRDGIDEIIKNYILPRKPLSELDVSEVYQDVIQPKLNQINMRVKAIKKSLTKKLALNVGITGGILGIGLLSNILTPELKVLLGVVGGIPAIRNFIETALELTGTPEEIRADNFYFLWKVSQKA